MKLFCRRAALRYLAALFFLAFKSPMHAAQEQTGKWPEKVVRIVVAGAPGGGDDFVTRLLALKLSELTRQQFIVENRQGAGGMIGQTLVAKSPPDGYARAQVQRTLRHGFMSVPASNPIVLCNVRSNFSSSGRESA